MMIKRCVCLIKEIVFLSKGIVLLNYIILGCNCDLFLVKLFKFKFFFYL